MKKIILLLQTFLCFQISFSQTTTVVVDDALKYAEAITIADLKKHLTIIASDEMEGRETGTEGQRKAAAYIESQFKAMGLLPAKALNGYQQLYPLHQDSLIGSALLINGKAALLGKDFYSQLTLSNNGNFNSTKLVFVGYGIEDKLYTDYANVNVMGKVVVFFLGEPKKEGKYFINGSTRSSEWTYPGVSKKLALAAAKGAVGAIIINQAQDVFAQRTIDNSKKNAMYYPRPMADAKPINHAIVSHEFAKTLFTKKNNFDSTLKLVKNNASLQSFGFEKKVKINYECKKYTTVINASNVLGIIEGTDKKEEYLVLTGHYDHLGKHDGKIYYGADDDGSGTVAVMQMAAAFAKAKAEGKGPRRTIVFMTVSGEEKGLWGSEYYSDHPVFDLDKTTADLNTDMIGRIDTERKTADTLSYVYVVGHDKLSSDLPIINEAANNKNTRLTLDYKYDDPNDQNRIYFRSDHYNFARKGVPVLFFYDGMLKADYHQPSDTVEKISWELYAKRAKMIFATAWEIANRNDMLKRDIPLPEANR
jgi:Zn-dependent M28 family amino/carboxypeptidase